MPGWGGDTPSYPLPPVCRKIHIFYVFHRTFVPPNVIDNTHKYLLQLCAISHIVIQSFFFEQIARPALMGRQNMIYCIIEPAAENVKSSRRECDKVSSMNIVNILMS